MYYPVLSEESGNVSGFAGFLSQYGGILLLILMVVLLYFFLIRPQRKQEKQVNEMRNNLKVNDEIVTIGGIVGIITNVSGKETITIVTSRDRTRIIIRRTAVSSVLVPAEEASNDESAK